jgi:hypothetical protein
MHLMRNEASEPEPDDAFSSEEGSGSFSFRDGA